MDNLLNQNCAGKIKKKREIQIYEIMHVDKIVANLDSSGRAQIISIIGVPPECCRLTDVFG